VQVTYTPRASWRVRGRITRAAGASHAGARFKISLEVAALDFVAPFTVALDGDATVLSPAMVDVLITEVDRRDAWQHARLMRHACK
jgi:hypothetical protein